METKNIAAQEPMIGEGVGLSLIHICGRFNRIVTLKDSFAKTLKK